MATETQHADLVLRGGMIVTLDDSRPRADALAARAGRIIAVGDERRISALISPSTIVVDLAGRLALPGFIEGHGHFLDLGESLMQLDLGKARSFDQVVELVSQSAAGLPPGEWIRGRGWHQEKWERSAGQTAEELPSNRRLCEVAPRNPVLLVHASGHLGLANAAAIEAAGEIIKDADKADCGILRERALQIVLDAVRANRRAGGRLQFDADRRRAVELAARECLSKGITSFQDAGSTFEEIDLFERLAAEGRLDLRLWVMISEDDAAIENKLDRFPAIDRFGHRLTVRAIKRLADGALGTHGAWLLEPYADLPSNRGENTTPIEDIARSAELAIEHGFQLCTHAIGDRACREVLDVYQKTFSNRPQAHDLRWRIEHAQHLAPADIGRFARLSVGASVQGIHCVSDAAWAIRRLGERRCREGAYAWRSLLDAGARLLNGSDAPVEDVDPLAGFRALVTRKTRDGHAFFPQQCLTRLEALKACGLSAAYAAFEDDHKGSLSAGKLADIAVLSHDITSLPPEQLEQAHVLLTILGGKIAFRAADCDLATTGGT